MWRVGLAEWIPAIEVKEIAHLLAPPPLPEPTELRILPVVSEARPAAATVQESGSQIRPWTRYWARQIDCGFAGLFFGLSLELVGLSSDNLTNSVLGIATLAAWIPIEALFLATWGFTPGKWLLKIRVTDETGAALPFRAALRRSALVWFAGMGVGFPLATFFTAWFQYSHLKKTGKTTYDGEATFNVHHQTVGAAHLVLTALALLAVVALIVLGETSAVP